MERKNTKIKALAFDLGRVLFDFDFNIALDKIKDRIGVSGDYILNDMFKEELVLNFEKGLINPKDFYSQFKSKTKCDIGYEEFVSVWSGIFTLKEDTFSLLRSLKPLYKLILISNINKLHYEFLKQKYPEVFDFFDTEILSFKVNAMKPSKSIYDKIITQGKVNKNEVVYIDDRKDLIAAAEELGFKGVQFVDSSQCKKDLMEYGVDCIESSEHLVFTKVKDFLKKDKCALLGLGNRIKNDDKVGEDLARVLKGKVSIPVFNSGVTPENIPLKNFKSLKRMLVVDSSKKINDNFQVSTLEEILSVSAFSTHTSLIFFEFLEKEFNLDIMFFLIKADNFEIGTSMGPEVQNRFNTAEKFFLNNFSGEK